MGLLQVNLLEYNQGYGISDRTQIRVYAVSEEGPEKGQEMLVAQWN